jgi:hypothetical protein
VGDDALIGVVGTLFAGGLLVWMALLMLLVGVRVLRGDIQTDGMLVHSARRTGDVDPERAVMAVAFPFVVLMYILDALHADVSGSAGRPSLPDVPQYLLTLLMGGNGVYLAGKFTRGA